MTTLQRKMNSHKKARAISSGFLGLINTFVLIPRQGIAGKRTLLRSVVEHHENDNSITTPDIALVWLDKSVAVRFLQPSQAGGV